MRHLRSYRQHPPVASPPPPPAVQAYASTPFRWTEHLDRVQDRNLRHPNGGAEASRITAQARRKLGALGSSLDQLRNILEDKSNV